MPKYIHDNGFEYKKEELEQYASNDGLTLEEYISNNNINVDTSGEISVIEGFKNDILNTGDEWTKIGYDIWTSTTESFIKPIFGEEMAMFMLGGDIKAETGWVDPENGEIVRLDLQAYNRDGYDAAENQRFYELAKENQKEGVDIKQVNVETGEDVGFAYAKMLQQRFDESLEIEKNMRQTVDEGSEGFLSSLKAGELDDALVSGLGFIKQTAMHAIAARLTLGTSMAATMMGSSWVAYNEQKAKAIYGEDDPNSFAKLVKNNEDESAIPAALGALGYVMERAGYKGMMKELAKKSFTGKKAVSLLMTSNKEGLTEYGQGLTERLNENLGKQMSKEDAVKDVGSYMWTEQAWDNYFAGFIGSTGMTGGGSIVQGALRSDPSSNQFINKKINNIAALTENMAKAGSKKELKSIEDQIQVEETDLKDYLESNKKLGEYLNEGEVTSLTDFVNKRRDTSAEIVNLKKGLKKGAISQSSFDAQTKILFENLTKIDADVKSIKIDANMRLLKADLDSGDLFVGDVKGLEQVRYETNEEFLQALEKEYKLNGIKMPPLANYNINGTKVGNKLLINMEIAAEQNAVATSSHEILHGIIKSTLQADDASGNLSGKGENMVKMFINQIGSSTLAKIEKALEKGNYKKNDDGTEKDFKEYGEEYLTIYAQLSKEGALTKNSLQKAGSWFANLWNNESDFKQIGFESGEQIQNFLDAYVQDTKKGEFRKSFKDLAAQGVKMKNGKVDFSKTQKDIAKKTLDNIGKSKNYDPASNKDQNNQIVSQLPAMVKVQVDNYFNSRPSLKVDPTVREEVQMETLFRLINPTKKGRSDITGFNTSNDSLYGYLNGRIKYRMLDTFKNNPTLIPDFSKADFDEATKFLTNENNVTTTKTPGVKTKLVQTKSRKLESLANINIESSPLIKQFAQQKIASIIEKGVNVVENVTKVLQKDLTNIMLKEIGVVGQKNGKLNIPPTYKVFLADIYRPTIASMEILKIRTNYKNLFKKEKMGFIDVTNKKNKNPKLKKDSNYRLDIFRNTTSKAEFTKYHTEGKKNKLIANQKNLVEMVVEAEIVKATDNYIIENSNIDSEVFASGLRNFVDSKTTQKQNLEDKSFDSVKYSREQVQVALDIKDAVLSSKNVFNNSGELLPPYNGFMKNKKDLKAIGDFIYDNMHLLTPQKDLSFIRKAYDTFIGAGKRGEGYESNIIDNAIALEKRLGKDVLDVILRKPTESDALPDAILKVQGVILNIEAKMANAQYSSITFAVDKLGNFIIKKAYSFKNDLNPLKDSVNEGVDAAKKHLKTIKTKKYPNGYDWVNIKEIDEDMHNRLIDDINPETGKSYFNGMSAKQPFALKFISEIYNLKKHPVGLIQLMGRGLFSMGNFGKSFNFNIPSLDDAGMGTIMLRVGSNTKKRAAQESDLKINGGTLDSLFTDGTNTKKKGEKKTKIKIPTGMKSYSFRAIPGIPTETLNKLAEMNSPHSIANTAGLISLINDKRNKLGLEAVKFSKTVKVVNDAINFSRSSKNPTKGITVLDFDDTLATSKSLVKYVKPDGETGSLTPEQYATSYQDMQDLGYQFDFSEFNKVVDGKVAPLFQKALKLQGKFGPENMFVLTARPAESASAIFTFLQANGLNIPLENITGLANSTSEAKALWMAGKVGEGYNDFYFADDALQNVQAVKNMLDQFDVKSKIQQAKVKFSRELSPKFNNILQDVSGIDSKKTFSKVKGQKRGKEKGSFRPFVPPGAEDFVGLLYNFMGKGKKGDVHREFFEKALLNVYNKAYRNLETARMAVNNNYAELRKKLPEVTKKLGKKSTIKDYSNGDAIRVYLWNKAGYVIPGISETDQANLSELVNSNPEMKLFADLLNEIPGSKEGYTKPTEHWTVDNIASDLYNVAQKVNRKRFLQQWVENKNEIFNDQNLNKIEAIYGKNFREALEDMLYRMEFGKSRPKGLNRQTNGFLNWINNSVGAIMFINGRSAVLQTMSMVNFLNFADNNIFAAAKAFANQPQYWSDFSTIFNSDYLKNRRSGLKQDINSAEMVESIKNSDNKFTAAVAWLLEKGFLPTKIMDSFAIAAGGSTFYRNRIQKLMKQGVSKQDAEKQAFDDMVQTAEPLQQSSRPDMVSQQQGSILGHLVLAFQNVTMQYTRIQKKALLDIINRRTTPPNDNLTQSNISNSSRILYYGIVQNAIFYSLQSAMFALGFGDEEEEEQQALFDKKSERVVNGMLDSTLRGTGIYGAILATAKNYALEMAKEDKKSYSQTEANPIIQALNLMPPVGSKVRKLVSAQRSLKFGKNVRKDMSLFNIDNPVWDASSNIIEATTNIPTNRVYNKIQNVREVGDERNSNLQRIFLLIGWDKWGLGVENEEFEEAKKQSNRKNKKKNKKRKSIGF